MNVRPRLVRFAAAAAVLVPFGLSVAAHVVPDAAGRGRATERPALVFGEYLVNRGRVPVGMTAEGVFRFRNAGETPLTILGLKPSCGCLTPKLDESRYAPGARGAFVVKADTAGAAAKRGDTPEEHYIDVKYDAGAGERTARVHLKYVLPERRVSVEPRALLVYQFDDEPVTREIVVSDERVPPLTVTGVDCSSPRLSVELRPAEAGEGAARGTVAVTIPGGLDKKVRAVLTLHTDDPAAPLLYVPVQAFGRDAAAVGAAAKGDATRR